jgi:hypothetical protein
LEKNKLTNVKNLVKFSNTFDWWNDSIDDMSSDQLEQFMVSIYELRRKQIERDDEQHAMMLNM